MTGPKRVTTKQLAANRANAQLSTGPRTPAGKSASRWNALKHGVLSQALIPPGMEAFESRADFDSLVRRLRRELAPASALEEMLVARIALTHWRFIRLLRAEATAFLEQDVDEEEKNKELEAMWERLRIRASAMPPDPATGQGYPPAAPPPPPAPVAQHIPEEQLLHLNPRLVLPLIRYQAAISRDFFRALTALERLQRARAGDFVPPPLAVDVDLSIADPDP